jgi:hypothetical protein
MSDSTKGAKAPLLARLAGAAMFAVTGKVPVWFGPSAPLAPQAPPEVAGRQFDYPTSTNLQSRPRVDEEISAEQLRALAENCDVLNLVISTRKDQLTGLKWQFQLKDKTARATPDPRLKMLGTFWEKPDQEHSFDDWIRPLLDDMFVLDAATIYPRKNLGGGIYGFEFVDGGTIKRVIDDHGRTPLPPDPAYQQILKGLPAVNYTREELLYLPRNLRTHKMYGLSPVQQIAMTVNIALRRQLHQLEQYTAGTVPDALAGVPEGWSPEQIGDFQRYWDELLSDDTAARRRVRFVPGAIAKGFTQTKDAVLKDQFDEWLARIVCYAFSVSPQWAVKEMNRATSETAQAMANAEGLAPLRQWVKRLVERCVQIGWGWTDIEFAWHEEEETNPKEQADVAIAYLKVGVLSINDLLADIGRDPIDGGDTHLIYTPTGAVPLSVALKPPPPPEPPKLGHNGGPPLEDEADQQEALLKAADPLARLQNLWAHFLKHNAPRVAEAVAAALPAPVQKAAGDDETPIDPGAVPPPKVPSDAQTAEEAAEAARLAASVPASIAAVIDDALQAMPWPAVQASTAAVLQDQALVGVQSGMEKLGQIAGITVKDATRLANPRAIAAAEAQAADLVRGVDQTTRDALNRLVVQAQTGGWSAQQLIDRIVADHAFSEARAETIARTEIGRSSVAGNIAGWRAMAAKSGLTVKKRVILGMNENHCVVCRSAVAEGAIGLDEGWTVGDAPPFHPNCYCNIVPVVVKKPLVAS